MAEGTSTEKTKGGRKKTVGIVALIVAVLAVLALLTVSCGRSGSAEAPKESPAEESAAPVVSTAPAASAKPEASDKSETGTVQAENEPGSNTGDTNSGNTGAANGNSGNAGNIAATTPEPTASPEPEHVHAWQPVFITIHHEEKTHVETVIVQPAWDEEEVVYYNVCSVCGAIGGNDIDLHIWEAHDGAGGWYSAPFPTGNIIHHDAITEQRVVVDSPAYDEEVIDHYICACGETRK